MTWLEARWALTYIGWETSGRATVQAASDEDVAFAASKAALRN